MTTGSMGESGGNGRRAPDRPPGWSEFVERFAERSAETAWLAALALVDRAAADAREGRWGRWQHHPRGELRRLRRDLVGALLLARAAVALQEEHNGCYRELTAELYHEAERAAARRRREQTLPAERARLAKARSRKKGKP